MKTVMYRDTHGSLGTFDGVINSNGRIYIEWNYGKGVNGNYITSIQGYDKSYLESLIEIDENLYKEYIDLPARSEGQKVVAAKILGMAKVDENKKCRECAHWAADPDDEYCAHPDIVKITIFGSSLPRARGNISRKPSKPEDDPVFGICGPEGKLWEQRPESRRLKR